MMRNRNKLFLSCAVLSGGLLATAGGAVADTCQAGSYTVSTTGPTVVGSQTQITYTVSGSPGADHVAAVVSSGSTNCSTASIVSVTGSPLTGNQSYAPAVGDPITGLGKNSCHDEAVKVNPTGSVVNFTITVSGARGAAPKTVVVKKGSSINRCEIVGIGEVGTAEIVAPVTEIIKEPGTNCAVEFTKDQVTGKVLHVQVTDDSGPGCQLHQTSVEDLELVLPNTQIGTCTSPPCSLGKGKFGSGDGYVHTGPQSCTTRIVGGRVYSWGDPCPD